MIQFLSVWSKHKNQLLSNQSLSLLMKKEAITAPLPGTPPSLYVTDLVFPKNSRNYFSRKLHHGRFSSNFPLARCKCPNKYCFAQHRAYKHRSYKITCFRQDSDHIWSKVIQLISCFAHKGMLTPFPLLGSFKWVSFKDCLKLLQLR